MYARQGVSPVVLRLVVCTWSQVSPNGTGAVKVRAGYTTKSVETQALLQSGGNAFSILLETICTFKPDGPCREGTAGGCLAQPIAASQSLTRCASDMVCYDIECSSLPVFLIVDCTKITDLVRDCKTLDDQLPIPWRSEALDKLTDSCCVETSADIS